jgi:hypothetical protein
VRVVYGSSQGLAGGRGELWTENSPGVDGSVVHGARCGQALAAGDFNGDGFADLAVGRPGGALHHPVGAVTVLYGSSRGLTAFGPPITDPARGRTSNWPGYLVGGFGSVLATGDFDGDGFDDLVIGTPDAKNSRGSVTTVYGSRTGLRAGNLERWTRRSLGGNARPYGRFGETLATGDLDGDGRDDLAIGSRGDGAVSIVYGSRNGLRANGSRVWRPRLGWPHRSWGVGANLAIGDLDGDGLADLAVGTPGSGAGRKIAAGSVHVVYGAQRGRHTLRVRAWYDVHPRRFFEFGAGLAIGDLDGDGRNDLAVAEMPSPPGCAPRLATECPEDPAWAGRVFLLRGARAGFEPRRVVLRAPGDRLHGSFGAALTTGDFDGDGRVSLVVSRPLRSATAVYVSEGSRRGFVPTGVRAAGLGISLASGASVISQQW